MELVVIIFMLIFIFALIVCGYVIGALANVKCLRALGYDKPIAGWIPFYSQYALAEVTGFESVDLGFNLVIPMNLFKFWWAAPIVLNLIPVIGSIAGLVFQIAAGGWNYGMLYALTENKDYQETKILGYITAFVPIIAIIKFFLIKPENVVYKYGQGQPGAPQLDMYNQPGYNPMYDNPNGFNPNFDQQSMQGFNPNFAQQPAQGYPQQPQNFGQQGYGQPVQGQNFNQFNTGAQGQPTQAQGQPQQSQDLFGNSQSGSGTFGQGVIFEQPSSDDPWANT